MSAPRILNVPGRALEDTRLSATAYRVLGFLSKPNEGDGWAAPKQKAMADMLGVSREAVNRAIKQLCTLGYVEAENEFVSGAGKRGLRYRVLFDQRLEGAATTTSSDDRAEKTEQKQPLCGNDHTQIPVVTPVVMAASPKESQKVTEIAVVTPVVMLTSQKEIPPIPPKEKLPPLDIFSSTEQKISPPTPKPRKRRSAEIAYSAEFQAVWMKWPSKRRERSDKPKAFERWEKGRQRWGVGLIDAAVDRYLADPDVRKENYRYCCLAEVFMNGKLEAAVEAAHAAATGAGESRKVWSSEEQAWVLRPA